MWLVKICARFLEKCSGMSELKEYGVNGQKKKINEEEDDVEVVEHHSGIVNFAYNWFVQV